MNNTPLIQFSPQNLCSDGLRFNFFHEAAHILLHGKKEIFPDPIPGISINAQKERKADEFAARMLCPKNENMSRLAQ
jgi:HTH-type transcriptional regulator / antitoxin HigA